MADHSLAELASLAGVTPRTVRYYIVQGLLPPPDRPGPGARYGDEHLARLRVIRRLKAFHLPLAEIRARLSSLDPEVLDDELTAGLPSRAGLGPSTGSRASESAVEYIRDVLGGRRGPEPLARAAGAGAEDLDRPAYLRRPSGQIAGTFDASASSGPLDQPDETLPPTGESARSQWDRVRLAPDIELHVRRPLSRPLNKKVEHLIRLARQLLEEDQP